MNPIQSMSDPFEIGLASAVDALHLMERMGSEVDGQRWSEITPAGAEFRLNFGATNGIRCHVFCTTFEQAKKLAMIWGILR